MARMSIDDKFLRDGRVLLLGQRFGWSRREAMGALLDIYAITYDREDDVISASEIDATAGEAGCAAAMIEVGLGDHDQRGVRIRGAAERIKYLSHKAEAGRRGGVISGKSRRNKVEARIEAEPSPASSRGQARGNPSASVPDVVPDPVPDSPPDQIPEIPHPARDPAVPTPVPVATELELRQAARSMLWREFGEIRTQVATELGITAQPLPAIGDPGERALALRLSEAGPGGIAGVVTAARHAMAVASAEARRADVRSVQYLTGALFEDRSWRRAVGMTVEDASRSRSPPANRRSEPPPERKNPMRPM